MKFLNKHKILSLLFLLQLGFVFGQKNSAEDEAYAEAHKGNFLKAINLYTKIIEKNPSNYNNYYHRAYCNYKLASYTKAITDCNKALALNPDIENKYYMLELRGSAYTILEKWQEALPDIQAAADYYSTRIDLDIEKAYIIYKLKKYSEAIEEYKFCLDWKKLTTEQKIGINRGIGFCYLYLDSINKAKQYWQKIKTIDSLSNRGLYLNAAILAYENNHRAALNCYKTMYANDTNEVTILYCYGIEYNALKQYDSAIAVLSKNPKILSASPDALNYLASAYIATKQYSKAIMHYTNYLKIYPKSAETYNKIAWTYFLQKKYPEALPYVNKSIELDKKNKNAIDTRGSIYYKLQQYSNAIIDFNTTLSTDTATYNSYYFRALSYIKTNQPQKACADLNILQQTSKYEVIEGEKPVALLLKENCIK